MLYGIFLALALSAGAGSEASPPPSAIRRVEVEGNHRFPTPGILKVISSAPGKPYDETAAREDLRRLYATGFFQDVSVTSRPADDGRVDVHVRVVELPYISEFVITGAGSGLEQRIREVLRKEKLELRPATPFSPARSGKAAALVRNLLRAQKYPQAEVVVDPEPAGVLVRAHMRIRTGPQLKVGRVEFIGNSSIAAGELLREMKHTRSGSLWAFWSDAGRYLPEELAADMESIRRLYQSRGFAAARIGPPEVVAQDAAPRRAFHGSQGRITHTDTGSRGRAVHLDGYLGRGRRQAGVGAGGRCRAPDPGAVPLRLGCARVSQDLDGPGARTRGLCHGRCPARAGLRRGHTVRAGDIPCHRG